MNRWVSGVGLIGLLMLVSAAASAADLWSGQPTIRPITMMTISSPQSSTSLSAGEIQPIRSTFIDQHNSVFSPIIRQNQEYNSQWAMRQLDLESHQRAYDISTGAIRDGMRDVYLDYRFPDMPTSIGVTLTLWGVAGNIRDLSEMTTQSMVRDVQIMNPPVNPMYTYKNFQTRDGTGHGYISTSIVSKPGEEITFTDVNLDKDWNLQRTQTNTYTSNKIDTMKNGFTSEKIKIFEETRINSPVTRDVRGLIQAHIESKFPTGVMYHSGTDSVTRTYSSQIETHTVTHGGITAYGQPAIRPVSTIKQNPAMASENRGSIGTSPTLKVWTGTGALTGVKPISSGLSGTNTINTMQTTNAGIYSGAAWNRDLQAFVPITFQSPISQIGNLPQGTSPIGINTGIGSGSGFTIRGTLPQPYSGPSSISWNNPGINSGGIRSFNPSGIGVSSGISSTGLSGGGGW